MLDKSLPYMDIIMKAPMTDIITLNPPLLSDGFYYRMYQPGDEIMWAQLETSVNEFDSEEDAMAYFNRVFLPYKDILPKRMCFIVDKNDIIVSTASAWFKENDTRRYPVLHWVSTSPTVQNKGLGKAIVLYALSLFPKVETNEKDVFLHTQTWSYPAVKLYAKLGFHITEEPLLDCKTNPDCFELLKTVLGNDFSF